jgi:hypothetical protein
MQHDYPHTPKLVTRFLLISALVVGFAMGLFGVVLYNEKTAYDEFMVGCLKERHQYECTAMWRND